MAFKMTHPDSKQEIQVDAENVAVFESQGWETAPNGYVSEDGVTVTQPDAADITILHAWQNGAAVRTLTGTTDDVPTVSFSLLETTAATLALYYGVAVSGQTGTEGAFVVDATAARSYASFLIDVVDGSALKRIYVPYGLITSVEDQVYANQEAIGFGVTISAHRSPTTSYNLKVWDTAAHS
jgi:hypothetical protein